MFWMAWCGASVQTGDLSSTVGSSQVSGRDVSVSGRFVAGSLGGVQPVSRMRSMLLPFSCSWSPLVFFTSRRVLSGVGNCRSGGLH